MSLLELRLAFLLAGVLALGGLLLWHDHGEIQKGREQIEKSDAKADAALKAKMAAESQARQDKANQIEKEADHVQTAIDDYATAHPVGVVRLCGHSNQSGGGVRQGTADLGGAPAAPGRPAAVPPVLGVDDGPDLSGGIDAILSAAEELGVVYQEAHRTEALTAH
jgi:hypothetical protein